MKEWVFKEANSKYKGQNCMYRVLHEIQSGWRIRMTREQKKIDGSQTLYAILRGLTNVT